MTLRIIYYLLELHPVNEHITGRTDLISFCFRVAKASGGFLGIGSKISDSEHLVLNQIVAELTQKSPEAVSKVIEES